MNPSRLLGIAGAGFLSAGSFWMSVPAIALALRARGVDDATIGTIAALPWLGLIATAPFVPAVIGRLGPRRTVLGGMLAAAGVLAGFATDHSLAAWCALSVAQGVTLAFRWGGMDTWVNGAVPDRLRGRLIGLYELIMSGSMAAGPALLAVLGVSGGLPFLTCSGLTIAAFFLLRRASRNADAALRPPPEAAEGSKITALSVIRAEPGAVLGIFAVGLMEAANLSLLPMFGIGLGFGVHYAALLAVMTQLGVAAGAPLLGALADRFDRRLLLILLAGGVTLGPLAASLLASGAGLWPALMLWGLGQGGLFTVGAVMLGARFGGKELARAMAVSMSAYTLGGLAGPAVLGALMAASGPDSLTYGMAAIGGVVLAAIALTARSGLAVPDPAE